MLEGGAATPKMVDGSLVGAARCSRTQIYVVASGEAGRSRRCVTAGARVSDDAVAPDNFEMNPS